ncbi:hypothetical protein AMTRI_Chr08g166750 [Amborella trichopoda]
MDVMYSKLHEKYTKLKARKFSELEHYVQEQNKKFLNYVAAAEDLMEQLKRENERLQAQVDELRALMSPDGSDSVEHKYAECLDLLMAESEKKKKLYEELERLRNLLEKQTPCGVDDDGHGTKKRKSRSARDLQGSKILSRCGDEHGTKKRKSGSSRDLRGSEGFATQAEAINITQTPNVREDCMGSFEPGVLCKSTTSINGGKENWQIGCREEKMTGTGDEVTNSHHANNLFQMLLECLAGMSFSIVNKREDVELSVLHQASGYSFSLTWVSSGEETEAELLYRLLSLGTLERVAPEWMREEEIIFSTSMCRLFFKKILQVAGVLM